MHAQIGTVRDPKLRVQIVSQRSTFDEDPAKFRCVRVHGYNGAVHAAVFASTVLACTVLACNVLAPYWHAHETGPMIQYSIFCMLDGPETSLSTRNVDHSCI